MLISGGEVAPISLSDSSLTRSTVTYGSGRGISLIGHWADYGAIYKRQLWVAVLVNKLANGTARLPLKSFVRAEDGRNEARDSPYARLLRTPNPRMDKVTFWRWTASTFEIHGEAMWIKIRPRPGSAPRELWPVHPGNMDTRRLDRTDEAAGRGVAGELVYVLNAGLPSEVDAIPAADVVHFRSFNPENVIRGMSPLEPLRQTLVNEDAARRATSSFWQRGARPGFVLSHPGKFTDPNVSARLKAQFDAAHAGPEGTGGTLVLEEAMTAHKLDLTAEEAQYIETRKLNREEACAIYDVPPPVVHILDRATFSNITEQMRSMYRDTMAPRLGLFEAVLDHQLRPDFGDDSLYAEFLMDEVLRGSPEARIQANATAIQTGQKTPKEVRDEDNRPFVDGSDRLFINAAVVPIETAAAQPVPANPEQPAIEAATVRSVMGRLGRASTLAEADPTRLVDGLNGDATTVLAIFQDAILSGLDVPGFHDRLKQAAGSTP